MNNGPKVVVESNSHSPRGRTLGILSSVSGLPPNIVLDISKRMLLKASKVVVQLLILGPGVTSGPCPSNSGTDAKVSTGTPTLATPIVVNGATGKMLPLTYTVPLPDVEPPTNPLWEVRSILYLAERGASVLEKAFHFSFLILIRSILVGKRNAAVIQKQIAKYGSKWIK